MTRNNHYIDPEDMFADTRMSFGDHIEELRTHLWRAIIGFLVIMVMVFVLDAVGTVLDRPYVGIGRPALLFIAKPVEDQLRAFYDRRVERVRKRLDENDAELAKINK